VLYVNPGSAGPRRFSLPVSVARLDIDGVVVSATIELLQIVTRQPSVARSTRR
jgi:predicted phosphodiesterase